MILDVLIIHRIKLLLQQQYFLARDIIRIRYLANRGPIAIDKNDLCLQGLFQALRYVFFVGQDLHRLIQLLLDVLDCIEEVSVSGEERQTFDIGALGRLHELYGDGHVDFSLDLLLASVVALGASEILEFVVSDIQADALGLQRPVQVLILREALVVFGAEEFDSLELVAGELLKNVEESDHI